MTQRPFITAALLSTALLALAGTASAQVPTPGKATQPQRPYRGLFGGGTSSPTSQGLTFNASFGAGYDEDKKLETPAFGSPAAPPFTARTGQFGIASAGLNYGVARGRVSGGLSLGAHGRYYPGFSDPIIGSYSGSGHLAMTVGSRTTITTSHSAGLFVEGTEFFYGDSMSGSSLPAAPSALGSLVNSGTYQSLRSDVQLSHSLTKRFGLAAGYGFYTNDSYLGAGRGRYSAQSVNAGITYAIAKGIGLRVGYGISGATIGPSTAQTPYGGRNLDAGIDFNRSLSLSRRSSITFGTGLVGVRGQNLTIRYFFTGHAALAYEVGRSWTLSGQVGRTADFFQTFGQPMLFDRGSMGFGGMVGRRLQVTISASAVKGTALTPIFVSGFTAGNAGVSLQTSITRELAVGLSYSYYRYEFDNSALLPPGVLSRMERQSVRVSLDLWAPLVTRARRPNVAR